MEEDTAAAFAEAMSAVVRDLSLALQKDLCAAAGE